MGNDWTSSPLLLVVSIDQPLRIAPDSKIAMASTTAPALGGAIALFNLFNLFIFFSYF